MSEYEYAVNDRVNTPDGVGTVQIIEEFKGSWASPRFGVKHDIFPSHRPRMYIDDIMYYWSKDLTPIKNPH